MGPDKARARGSNTGQNAWEKRKKIRYLRGRRQGTSLAQTVPIEPKTRQLWGKKRVHAVQEIRC